MKDEKQLTLADVLFILKKNLVLLILLSVLAGAAGFVYSRFFVTPMYTSKITMYVKPTADTIKQQTSFSDEYSAYNYAKTIISTYIEILKLPGVMDDISVNAYKNGLNYSPSDIAKAVSIAQRGTTELFDITVTTPSPEDSFLLANLIAELSGDKISAVVKTDYVQVADYARMPVTASNNNTVRNTILGLFLGFALAVGISFLLWIIDIRIKSEEDLSSNYQIPVLGSIPYFECDSAARSHNSKKRKKVSKNG